MSERAERRHTVDHGGDRPVVPTALARAALRLTLSEAEAAFDELAAAYLVEAPGPDAYRQRTLIRLHARTQQEDPMAYLDQLRGIADALLNTLRQCDEILAPSHPDTLPTPHAYTLPEELRVRITTEDEAAASCRALLGYVPQILRECHQHGEHERTFELAHLAWPLSHLYGLPRLPLIELGLASAREVGNRRATAMMLTGLVDPRRSLGQPEAAVAAADEAEEIYRELDDARGQGQAVQSRAKVLLANLKHGESAITLAQIRTEFEDAGDLFRRAEYLRGSGLSMINLANVAELLGERENALGLYREALDVLIRQLPAQDQKPDPYDAAIAALGAARTLAQRGQALEAFEYLKQAESLMAQISTGKGLGLVAENTAAIVEAAGDQAGAITHYTRAKDYFETTDEHGLARVTAQLARLNADAHTADENA